MSEAKFSSAAMPLAACACALLLNGSRITDFKARGEGQERRERRLLVRRMARRATRDAAWPKIMEDERMKPDQDKMPFDGQRMFWGGFKPFIELH